MALPDTDTVEEDTSSIEEVASAKRVAEAVHDDDLPPKVDSEVETLAEGVTKQLIKEGHGATPAKHSTCFLHYRAWITNTLHKFNDTWQEQQPLELVLGHEKPVLRGLALGIASMKAGERALLRVGWQLGYGEEGSFSFPNVPPRADLIYEVEFIGFEEAKEGRSRAEMTVEERIEAADRRKVDGNEAFKEDKLEVAMQQYEMALAYMGDDFMFQLFGKYKDMANAVKHPCHLNMAACFLKLQRYNEAIIQCNVVLAEEENNVKALFRRGKARVALGQTEEAKEDFKKVRRLSPEDKTVVRELRLVAEQDKQLYEKQKELYKGLFGPPPTEMKSQKKWYAMIWQWFKSIFKVLQFSRRKSD
ncbi:hypothetical protein O6H91_20G059300 [Diphasiastrum complanatum]|uniref:Uncharacterized protein n=1 Tax=Diphasiastrum complanatum TaxID=34168 RepID=A0ACC2AQX6_DIPCM|nr:hypothetical protein O6H91_20G059300 [Diphasiastrum complanatum]